VAPELLTRTLRTAGHGEEEENDVRGEIWDKRRRPQAYLFLVDPSLLRA